jgi:hypothetical protein
LACRARAGTLDR